jgi:hypothetical protein
VGLEKNFPSGFGLALGGGFDAVIAQDAAYGGMLVDFTVELCAGTAFE